MREVALAVCKWLEFIYPTDVATHVFYRGRVIPFAAGGQQGCPLIGACHALVKRMVHESLGLLAPLAGSQIQLLRIDTSPPPSDHLGQCAPLLRMTESSRETNPKSCVRSKTRRG